MFPRVLINPILAQFESRDLVFLLGTRQTGKTTLAHLLAQDSAYSKKETGYFDFFSFPRAGVGMHERRASVATFDGTLARPDWVPTPARSSLYISI